MLPFEHLFMKAVRLSYSSNNVDSTLTFLVVKEAGLLKINNRDGEMKTRAWHESLCCIVCGFLVLCIFLDGSCLLFSANVCAFVYWLE